MAKQDGCGFARKELPKSKQRFRVERPLLPPLELVSNTKSPLPPQAGSKRTHSTPSTPSRYGVLMSLWIAPVNVAMAECVSGHVLLAALTESGATHATS